MPPTYCPACGAESTTINSLLCGDCYTAAMATAVARRQDSTASAITKADIQRLRREQTASYANREAE